jgi:methylenetetrahydrofolate dehydrogenase (NADP+)/methenyltetrahydrofolate cyclohydrolase
MSARLIDGKAVAQRLRTTIAAEVQAFAAARGFKPGLAVVLVGHNPASEVYVRNKTQACQEAGFISFSHHLPADVSQAALLELIGQLNRDRAVHGILVQLPLPPHIDSQQVIAAIDPAKDVDGFHPMNVGRLALGLPSLVPCTPQGCMILLREALPDLAGREALVIGRSNIVGKPMAHLLLQADCTVTIAHSRSRDLPELCRRAEIVIAAVGRPEFVLGEWLQPGAVVIDVGINRVPGAEGKTRLVGDVQFASAAAVAAAITPVPGGVGPMTIACLLQNTLQAAQIHNATPPA